MFDPSLLQSHPLINIFFEVVRERFHLTKREGEVLQILAFRGVSNKELGEILDLSEKTAKNHVANIQRKLNVRSSRELQAAIFRHAIIPSFKNILHIPEDQLEGNYYYASVSH
jgi:DNA-binding CsgD family transcriptional regulator